MALTTTLRCARTWMRSRGHCRLSIRGRLAGGMLPFTHHLRHLARYAAILAGLILILAVLRPPAIGPAPVEGIEVTKPPWIFLPLFAVENWVSVAGFWIRLPGGGVILSHAMRAGPPPCGHGGL